MSQRESDNNLSETVRRFRQQIEPYLIQNQQLDGVGDMQAALSEMIDAADKLQQAAEQISKRLEGKSMQQIKHLHDENPNLFEELFDNLYQKRDNYDTASEEFLNRVSTCDLSNSQKFKVKSAYRNIVLEKPLARILTSSDYYFGHREGHDYDESDIIYNFIKKRDNGRNQSQRDR